MKILSLAAGRLVLALISLWPLALSAQVRSIYSLGVSLDGVPGLLTRAEDGSFYGIFAAGGREGFGSIVHLSADATTRATVFDFADATTNATVTAGIIVGITNGFVYGVFTDFPDSGSTNLLYRVGTNGSGFTPLRGLPVFYSSILLASDRRFYFINGSELDRCELDGSGLVSLTNNFNLTRLVEGSDGLLYGNSGTAIGRVNKDGSQFTTLTNTTRGILALVWGGDGRLYGSTDDFPNGQVVFGMNADGGGFQALGTIDSGGQDSTIGTLLDGANGKLYATFGVGPQFPASRIVSVDKNGGANTVFDLPAAVAGGSGQQWITLGSDGLLYGVASQGGTNSAGLIYAVSRAGTGFAKRFEFGGAGPSFVQSALTLGSDGRLYGSADSGGFNNRGMVFGLNADGGGFQVLKEFFSSSEGVSPRGGVVEGAGGVLYGTTQQGGANGGGTVFRINRDGTGFGTLAHLGTSAGTNPVAQLLLASDGALYGSCINGGTSATNGTLWKVQTNGTGFTVLKAFAATGSEGRRPFAPLMEGADGMIYGVTDIGGSANKGVVFKLAKDGTGYAVLRNLLGFGDPANPEGRLLQLADGTLLGTAAAGGSAGLGCIFQIQTNGSSYRVVHSFVSANSDGRVPIGGLVPAGDGSLLGTTRFGGGQAAGTVFSINSDGSAYQILYRFSTNYPSAMEPWAALTPSPVAGVAFGSATLGGPAFGGILFRVDLATAAAVALSVRSTGAGLELSWPASATGLQVQSNIDLSNPNGWKPDPGSPSQANGIFRLAINPSGGGTFYRLAKP